MILLIRVLFNSLDFYNFYNFYNQVNKIEDHELISATFEPNLYMQPRVFLFVASRWL